MHHVGCCPVRAATTPYQRADEGVLSTWLEEWNNGTGGHPGRRVEALSKGASKEYQRRIDGDLQSNMLTSTFEYVKVARVLTSRQTQTAAVQLLKTAESGMLVILLGYYFDRADIAEELVEAAARGACVTCVFDRGALVKGTSKHMKTELDRLASTRVVVRILEGEDTRADYEAVGRSGTGFPGLQHAKALLVESRAIIGSTNWTTSSRGNSEMSLLVEATTRQDRKELQSTFWRVVLRSETHERVAVEALQRAASAAQTSGRSRG
jgi:phosphatidylserine/phosphatidylglycerophosphate/cardiolipin synthase-like enzyme